MIQWLQEHMLPCVFKGTTGLSCPGCGLQRALISLFKGEVLDSIIQFPPLIPILSLLLLIILKLNTRKVNDMLLRVNVILLVLTYTLNFILKNYYLL